MGHVAFSAHIISLKNGPIRMIPSGKVFIGVEGTALCVETVITLLRSHVVQLL